jgi:triosephosphate isomerase
MIKPILVANWKMNKTVGESLDYANRLKTLIAGMSGRRVVIAPPFTALYAVGAALKDSGIGLAAQNLSENEDGACTGEVSARMLADAGCTYVIVGHSERRTLFGESDEMIRAKIGKALEFGLKPIFCVGETLQEREAGLTFEVIERQIKEGLNRITAYDMEKTVLAYEPVWAIGTGKTATPEQAGEAHAFIRRLIEKIGGAEAASRLPLIYGGSVRPDNIGRLMAQADINGALVGGAGLDADIFAQVVAY